MTREIYAAEDLGVEVVAPSGYYTPLDARLLEFRDRLLLYVLGNSCIEASCCGVGSWNYLRVEGYVLEGELRLPLVPGTAVVIDTIEDDLEKRAIVELLSERHSGARIEFR